MDGHIRTCWFIFYRYNHGIYSDEIKSIISPKASFSWNTRFTKIQHPYAHKLDTNRTKAFANSLIPMTSRDWNSLLRPSSQQLITFNLSRPASTDILDSDLIPKSHIFTKQWSTADYRDCTFLVQHLLVSISYKKKKTPYDFN